MNRSSRIRAGCVAAAILLAVVSSPASAAGTRTIRLYGHGMAKRSMAAAMITQTAPGDYRVKVTASELPLPRALRTSPRRYVYVAWVSDSRQMHAMMLESVPLKSMGMGVYQGTRVVMVQHVGRIFVTAETSPKVHTPRMPEVTVLDSSPM